MEMEQEKKNEEKWRTEVIEKIIAESQIEIPDILARSRNSTK